MNYSRLILKKVLEGVDFVVVVDVAVVGVVVVVVVIVVRV